MKMLIQENKKVFLKNMFILFKLSLRSQVGRHFPLLDQLASLVGSLPAHLPASQAAGQAGPPGGKEPHLQKK